MKRIGGIMILALLVLSALPACGHKHSYGEWKAYKQATCEEDGEWRRYCESCGEFERKTQTASGHDYIRGGRVEPVLSYSFGYTPYTCADCGAETGEDYVWASEPGEVAFHYYESMDAYAKNCNIASEYTYAGNEQFFIIRLQDGKHRVDGARLVFPETVQMVFFFGVEDRTYQDLSITVAERTSEFGIGFHNVTVESENTILNAQALPALGLAFYGKQCSFTVTSVGRDGASGKDKDLTNWIGDEAAHGKDGEAGVDAFVVNGECSASVFCDLTIKGGDGGNGGRGGDVLNLVGVFGNGGNGGKGGDGGAALKAGGKGLFTVYEQKSVTIEGGAGGIGGRGGYSHGIGVHNGSQGANGQTGAVDCELYHNPNKWW